MTPLEKKNEMSQGVTTTGFFSIHKCFQENFCLKKWQMLWSYNSYGTGTYLEKNMIRKDTRTPMLTTALLTTAKTQKQPEHPLTEERIKKTWDTAQPIEWNNAICGNIDRPTERHTKWTQSVSEEQMLCDTPYMRNLKGNDTNEFTYKTGRLTDLVNEL